MPGGTTDRVDVVAEPDDRFGGRGRQPPPTPTRPNDEWPILDGGGRIAHFDQATKLRAPSRGFDNPDTLISHSSSSSSTSDDPCTPPPPPLSEICKEINATVHAGQVNLPSHVDPHIQRLLDLTERTKYNMCQRNGQRIYGPPPNWDKEPPSKGSEIFVGRVPRDCYEDELVPVFEKVGMIYEFRLMMDFSGSNRGFFFVRYTCVEDAKRACRELDNYEIRPNKRLGVLLSVDNRKLWISGIPNNITAEEIKEEMLNITEGVTDVILYRNQTDKSKTRKYAFVEYESHRAAALARRRLVPSKICLKGQEIEKVDWAEPEDEPDEDTMAEVKVLFVRNLTEAVTEDMLREKFNEWSDNSVERVKKTKDYAFVHFRSRFTAEVAKRRAMGELLDDEPLEIEWSKPVDKNNYNMRKQLTKVLSNPFPVPVPPPVAVPPPYGSMFRGIAPRKRGAAGILGLGAPGTAPPRNLLRRLGVVGGQSLPDPIETHHTPIPAQTDKGHYPMVGGLDPNIVQAICDMRVSQLNHARMYGCLQPQPIDHYGYPAWMAPPQAHPAYLAASAYPQLPAPVPNGVFFNQDHENSSDQQQKV